MVAMSATKAGGDALAPGVTCRLVLVRHGEPEVSAAGRCYGKLDVGLAERGREQVQRAARWLEPLPLHAIYASPRRRAYESAGILAAGRALDVRVEDQLCEIDFGEFEGLTYEEVERRYPNRYRLWMERPTEVTFPGGESFKMMRERVMRVTTNIRLALAGRIVALVTHGGVNRIILADALGMASKDIFRLGQSYAAVSMIDYYGNTPVVRLVNYSGLGGQFEEAAR